MTAANDRNVINLVYAVFGAGGLSTASDMLASCSVFSRPFAGAPVEVTYLEGRGLGDFHLQPLYCRHPQMLRR